MLHIFSVCGSVSELKTNYFDYQCFLRYFSSKMSESHLATHSKTAKDEYFIITMISEATVSSFPIYIIVLNIKWCKNTGRNSERPKLGIPNFFSHIGRKRLQEVQNGQNWVFWTFQNHFGAKRLEEVLKSVRFTLDWLFWHGCCWDSCCNRNRSVGTDL